MKEMKKNSRVRAVVNLDQIIFNMDSMKRNVNDDTKMIGVIKADGYGHGAVALAKALEERPYMWGFAVAACDEAMILRRNGITLPILVLGYAFSEDWEDMILNDVRMTVYSYEMAVGISKVAQQLNKEARVHIKVDTGMSRIGFLANASSVEEIKKIKELSNLTMEGLFTHFAKADETDKDATMKQTKRYFYIRDCLAEEGVKFALYHCSNSASIIDLPELNMDAVRAGIALYGLYPSEEVKKDAVPLKTALSLISHVTHVKWCESGTAVGYGGTYVTTQKTKIATIPVGYGDGYPRSLSNKGYVLIHGQKAPIIGRICMDQFMVDVTNVNVSVGDEAVLIGKSIDSEITVKELSDLSGRFNYEFVCDLGKRIPREYVRNGEIISQMNYE